jgi:hypothetical protein
MPFQPPELFYSNKGAPCLRQALLTFSVITTDARRCIIFQHPFQILSRFRITYAQKLDQITTPDDALPFWSYRFFICCKLGLRPNA